MSELRDEGRPTPVFSLKTEKAPFDRGKDIIASIVALSPFWERVQAGITRVEKTRAESGFGIFAYKEELIFSRLFLGGKKAESGDFELGFELGEEMSAKVNLPTEEELLGKLYNDAIYHTNPRLFARFHFHPKNSGFSNTDIVNYEKDIDNDLIRQKDFLESFGRLLFEKEDVALPVVGGLISPVSERTNGGANYSITAINLLVLSGSPSSSYYQAVDLTRVSINKQAELFKKSGFNVLYKTLPVTKGKVDFSPLTEL